MESNIISKELIIMMESMEKDYMRIKFNTDDNIPLNKVLNFLTITVIIRCVFEKDGKYYPQV